VLRERKMKIKSEERMHSVEVHVLEMVMVAMMVA
jgi:hypothetical protein